MKNAKGLKTTYGQDNVINHHKRDLTDKSMSAYKRDGVTMESRSKDLATMREAAALKDI